MILRLLSFGIFILTSQCVWANGKWQFGVGPLTVIGNHYRGSDQEKVWIFPLPYFSYKSERLEADPSFIRGVIYNSKRFIFKASIVPGLRVNSKNNRARAGMPDLDYTIEIGPMFIYHLWQSQNNNLILNIEWPLRKSFATDLTYLKSVGFFQIPYLNFIQVPERFNGNWYSEISIGPMFADHHYHSYYYSVDKQFAKSDRPYYQAKGGYSGLQSGWVLNYRWNRIGVINFLRWDNLNNAVFEDSPLIKKKNYFIGGVGIFWMIE